MEERGDRDKVGRTGSSPGVLRLPLYHSWIPIKPYLINKCCFLIESHSIHAGLYSLPEFTLLLALAEIVLS